MNTTTVAAPIQPHEDLLQQSAHVPNEQVLTPEAMIDALINLGGEATTEQLKEYFGLETGQSLTGVRTKLIRAGLIEAEPGRYLLVDCWVDEPKVTSTDLIKALDDLGGQATTDQIKAYFNLDNGRILTGARNACIGRNQIEVNDGVYQFVEPSKADKN